MRILRSGTPRAAMPRRGARLRATRARPGDRSTCRATRPRPAYVGTPASRTLAAERRRKTAPRRYRAPGRSRPCPLGTNRARHGTSSPLATSARRRQRAARPVGPVYPVQARRSVPRDRSSPTHARRTAEHAGAACGKLAERHLRRERTVGRSSFPAQPASPPPQRRATAPACRAACAGRELETSRAAWKFMPPRPAEWRDTPRRRIQRR